ncbi:MAG TPA: DUF937 domain-containing protein [Mycobacterium sp.]|nr:DUF937 domain-containing protein [Mycobacterium sp.]
MAGLDDLYAQIPTSDIAAKLGADEGEVDSAIHTLVPLLLSGLHQTSEDPERAGKIESVASSHAARGLLDTGVGFDQVDESAGQQAIATIFGGNDADQVATALARGGVGNRDTLRQLLPVVIPIVLAYIGKQLSPSGARQGGAPQQREASAGGGLAEVLGSILGAGSGDKSLGGVLGSVLSGKGGALGDILGGLLGGKK